MIAKPFALQVRYACSVGDVGRFPRLPCTAAPMRFLDLFGRGEWQLFVTLNTIEKLPYGRTVLSAARPPRILSFRQFGDKKRNHRREY